MNIWITSDLHFDHANILKYNPATRGVFNDIEHMNSEMKNIWNEKVSPTDLVYILGDVAFCKPSKAISHVRALNGRKILIEGNHDSRLVENDEFRNCFEAVYTYHEIKHNGHKICMMHYPISEWNQCHHGSIMLHGHLHGNPSGLTHCRVRDVGFDATGNVVSLLDDIVNDALTSGIRTHGWK
jgi:calcineurin-like phosphoesterase family protein